MVIQELKFKKIYFEYKYKKFYFRIYPLGRLGSGTGKSTPIVTLTRQIGRAHV